MKVSKINFHKNENIQFIALLLTTGLVLYFLPQILKIIFFIVTFYLFFKSKNNYFWLAYFFTIITDIGGFYENLVDDLIAIGPVKISLLLLYSTISFIKVKYERLETDFFLKFNLNLWVFYIFFLMYIGFIVIGNSGGGKSGLRYYYELGLMLPVITTLYSTPKLLPNEESFIGFSKLIFISIFFNIVGQFIHLLTSIPVYYRFSKGINLNLLSKMERIDYMDRLIRPVYGVFHTLLAIFLSMIFIVRESKQFQRWYLLIVLFLSIFSIFITATRGWIIASLIFVISSLFLMKLDTKVQLIKLLVIGIISMISFYFLSEPVRNQSDKVIERLMTLESLAKGDLTAKGTNARLTRRHVPVINLFYKRPIFGSGFSMEGMATSDPHVGNQNVLMTGGLVGYFIILLVWVRIVMVTIKSHKSRMKYKNYKGEVLLVIPLLLSLIAIHSSSMSFFRLVGFVYSSSVLLMLGVVFALMNRTILYFPKKN